jgi:uncharacterized protein (TIGR02266 family)
MTQETRKERRVKIVSLNVRYRSATLEEFIENHAHDVSRGGIFIKAANPFPPGTLLKFEIRLANDQAVIAGVGRVVWKRDVGAAVGDMPSGMGVKFIKLDEPSKAVIDRLVSTKADAGVAFETEPEVTAIPPGNPLPVPPSQTGRGRPPPPPSHGRAIAVAARKPTMIGVGGTVGSPAASSVPPRASTHTGPPSAAIPNTGSERPPMFPKSVVWEDSTSAAEPTLIKQAAELLEEALREAGGSLAEVGSNPLFGSHGASLTDPGALPAGAAEDVAHAEPVDAPPKAVGPTAQWAAKLEPAQDTQRAVGNAPKVASRDVSAVRDATTRASSRADAGPAGPRRTRLFGIVVAVSAAVVSVVVGVAWTRSHLPGGVVQPAAAPHPTVTVVAAPPVKVEPLPASTTTASATPPPASSPSIAPAASTGLSASASFAPPAAKVPAVKPPVVAPSVVAPPAVMSSAFALSDAAPPVAAPPVSRPRPKPQTVEVAAPSATAETDEETPAPPAKPKPPAVPKKPAKPSDDNPY